MVVVGPIHLVGLLEVRDVVAAELGEAAALQPVERLDDTRAAEIDRAETARVVVRTLAVDRMRRPAIVERIFGVPDNCADRTTNAHFIPRVVDERLMNGRIEEWVRGQAASERRPSSEAMGCIASTTFAMCWSSSSSISSAPS